MRRRIRVPALSPPTLLDRIVGYIDPVAAARRAAARQVLALSGGYVGARRDRRATQEWQASTGSADSDLLPDLPALRERSRELYRNAPLATGAVNTVVTNVVGTGLRLQARIDRELLGLDDEAADRWEREAERIWCGWADTKACDIRRVQDFSGLQDTALRTVLLGGDAFAVKRFREREGEPLGFRLQMIEGDRVANPNYRADGTKLDNGNRCAGGVEVDVDGAPVAYHVLDQHPGSAILGAATRSWTRVPAFAASGRRQVLHLYRPTRFEQTRGEPYLAAVIEPLKQLDRYRESELMAAVVASMLTIFVKSESGEGLDIGTPTSETGGSTSDEDYKLAPGAILDLAPGEDVTAPQLGRPNAAFDPFTTAILRQIGVALELPFEVLIKHFTASYSAARAALLEAWKFFRARRDWLAWEFCQPSYEEVIGEAVARGMLDAPGFDDPLVRAAWCGAEWIGPSPGQLDPSKEVEAAKARIDLGISTHAAETQELTGRDWEQVHAQLVKEKRRRLADGLEQPALPPKPTAPQPDPDLPERPDET